MFDNKFYQWADDRIRQTEWQKNTVRQGKAGIKPYRQRLDKQRNSWNTFYQYKHGQSAQARDFR